MQIKVHTPRMNKSQKVQLGAYQRNSKFLGNKCWKWFFHKTFSLMIKKGYLDNHYVSETDVHFTTSSLDINRLDEQIARNRDAIEGIYMGRVTGLVVGRDIMHKIMTEPEAMIGRGQTHVTLDMESNHARYNDGSGGRGVVYQGLKVILVPWFEGILPLGNVHVDEIYADGRDRFGY
jgi:hypothetical protein